MPYAVITASSNGDNTVITGTAGMSIRVLAFTLTWSAAVNAKWKSGAGTDLTGLMYGIGTGPSPLVALGPDFAGRGLFQTASGDNLVLNLSAGTPVGGFLTYELAAQ